MELQGLQSLFLLLPLAALSGWYVARRHYNNKTVSSANNLNIPPEYLSGLNYVLNEEPDKAIEVFIKLLEVDSGTVETHMALGSLFRRRGEVDRAIRIHQNLIARPNLSAEFRAQALLELGIDYMRSGLLDRAETLFDELVSTNKFTDFALMELLDIYQQEKEWDKAIATARRIEQVKRVDNRKIIAQFYCELSEQALGNGDEQESRAILKQALNSDAKCARASMLLGQIELSQGKSKHAIRAFKRVIKQDPECTPEVLQALSQCYRDTGKLDEFKTYLEELVNLHGNITPMIYLTNLIDELDGREQAYAYISDQLKRRPTVRGVKKLMEYLIHDNQGDTNGSLETVRLLVDKLLESHAAYKCNQCGFDAMQMHWYCPSCKSWDTIKPIHGVDGE